MHPIALFSKPTHESCGLVTSGTVCDALLKLSAQNQTHAGSARGPRDPRVRARESRTRVCESRDRSRGRVEDEI